MNTIDNNDILESYEIYKGSVFEILNDFSFWQSFLKLSIENYQEKPVKPDKVFFSIFHAWDINPQTGSASSKTDERVFIIKTYDLDKHSQNFFNWIMILSILKAYNAAEIFLFEAIRLAYYPKIKNPLHSKAALYQIQSEIEIFLKNNNLKISRRNNQYLILFLKVKSSNCNKFIQLPMGFGFTSTWDNFFELVSILRNVIAHNGAVLNNDTLEKINAKGKDVFEKHFNLPIDNLGYSKLQPVNERFSEFIAYINTFILNCVKLILDKSDLSFININKPGIG